MSLNPEIFLTNNRKAIKFAGIILLALSINFTIEIVFSLVYRNYSIFSSSFNFFYTLFILFVVIAIISGINSKLDRAISWEKNATNRFFIQAFTNVFTSVLVFFGFKLLGIFILTFSFWSETFGFTSLSDIGTTLIIVSIYMLIYVFIELSINLLERWRLSLASIEAFKKENVEFRFNMLRSQINPHFLFNSLNTLSSLIYADQDLASKYTKKLSNVYRNILEHRNAEAISLKEELTALENYIDLLKIRFQEALIVNMNIDEAGLTAHIPPLTLQMLVENAIKHNVVSKKSPLQIAIKQNGDYLEIENNLQKKNSELDDSTELGLKNIKSRFGYLTDKAVIISETISSFKVQIPLVYEA